MSESWWIEEAGTDNLLTALYPSALSRTVTSPYKEWPYVATGTVTEVSDLPRMSSLSILHGIVANPRKEGKYYRREWTQSSTLPEVYPTSIEQKFKKLFRAAREEVFEDGMVSNFSKGLVFLIERYSNVAIDILTRFITTETVNPEVASEALRWIGHIEHPASYHYRRWLLEQSLFRSSARVRDGALLGLALLDDPHAILYLKRAIRREIYPVLREDMENVLAQLENDH